MRELNDTQNNVQPREETCTVCFKIVCRGCGWEPDDTQLLAIQRGNLTACPVCGWVPGDV